MNTVLRESLKRVDFNNLCEQWGDTPYRLLIQEHVRKTRDLIPDAIRGIIGALTEVENEAVNELFQHYYLLANTNSFWKNSTASHVLIESTKMLSEILQNKGAELDNRILFSGFNFATLSFAGVAFYSKEFRKAIGIRKSLFVK